MNRCEHLRRPARLRAAIVCGVPLLWAGAAGADGSAVYRVTAEGESMNMEYLWRGDSVIAVVNPQGYLLVREGKPYMVMEAGGTTRVLDMSDAGAGADQTGMGMSEEMASFSLEPTGRTETHAGIEGQVYTATGVTKDGRSTTGEIVLTDQARVAELTRVFASVGNAYRDSDDAMSQAFLKRNQGMLRYTDGDGNEMTLTSISDQTAPAEDFELPAEPMTMPGGFSGGAGDQTGGQVGTTEPSSAAEEERGGLFGGLFGGGEEKIERQEERQTGNVNRRVDEETDSAIDKAVDGALNKLFGK